MKMNPCPYCRCHYQQYAASQHIEMDESLWWRIECRQCKLSGPARNSKRKALQDWNRMSFKHEEAKP